MPINSEPTKQKARQMAGAYDTHYNHRHRPAEEAAVVAGVVGTFVAAAVVVQKKQRQ